MPEMILPDRQGFIEECFELLIILFENPPKLQEIAAWSDSDLKTSLDWLTCEYLKRQPGGEGMESLPKPWVLQRTV